MNAEIKWGMDKPEDLLKLNENLKFVEEHLIKINENKLKGFTKFIFENVYCGKISEAYYKIYEFEIGK